MEREAEREKAASTGPAEALLQFDSKAMPVGVIESRKSKYCDFHRDHFKLLITQARASRDNAKRQAHALQRSSADTPEAATSQVMTTSKPVDEQPSVWGNHQVSTVALEEAEVDCIVIESPGPSIEQRSSLKRKRSRLES